MTLGNPHLAGAALAGVYTTDQGELPGREHHELLMEALTGALADSGLQLENLDGIANVRSATKSAANSAPGLWSELIGKRIHYHEMVDVAGASHCAGILHAAAAISAGLCDTVAVLAGGMRGTRAEIVEEMAYMHGEFDISWGSLVASWFAMIGRRYMRTSGATEVDFAEVAVAAREWGALHPQALMRDPITVHDVLRSPYVAEPLHRLDCCLANNGAAAIIMTRRENLPSTLAPVVVLGGGEAYAGRGYTDLEGYLAHPPIRDSAGRALRMAGVRIDDIDVFGLYDPFSPMLLLQLEELGLCGPGEAGELLRSRALRPGGRKGLNTHGGAMAWGNSMNSFAHAVEVVIQLQGRAGGRQVPNAQLGLVHGMGGTLNLHSTLVLGRG
jgi:acetyl-CoA acetyltransferase